MNRSEELCKLFGVEPKTICSEYHTCEEYCSKEQDGRRVPLCINVKDNCYNGECYKLIYPDLTKPSNFVQLLFFKFPNFNNEYYNILEFMSDNFVEIENANEYIESLYEQLKLEDKRIIKDLAKQAQATQWDY